MEKAAYEPAPPGGFFDVRVVGTVEEHGKIRGFSGPDTPIKNRLGRIRLPDSSKLRF
jgi:hypothetical protein